MSNGFDPNVIKEALTSRRWAGLVRLGVSAEAIGRWDGKLLRESRVLVPIDVQALYVPADDTTRFVRLPLALTTPDGEEPAAMPEPFDAGETRPAGVHLHWAPPDALLRGTLREVADGSTNRLGLPPLPDRWVILRLVVPKGTNAPAVSGWVLEADTAKAVPLGNWPAASAATAAAGKTVAKQDLTGTVGGSVNWAGVYDAVGNRLAFHDPLDDLDGIAPQGVVGDRASYVVAGWWSDPKLDPLDGARTTASLHDRLKQLGWRLIEDAEGGDQIDHRRAIEAARRESLGLVSAKRYPLGTGAEGPIVNELAPTTKLEQLAEPAVAFKPVSGRFVDQASRVIATEPRWPRSTLLHGVVYGAPVRGAVPADQQPASSSLDVVIGRHGDDVAATLAASGLGVTSPTERRSMERLLAAFAGQILARLGTPDGVVDAEEHEHVAGFASRPGGLGPVERLQMGGQAGPLTAGRAARSEQARLKAESASTTKGAGGIRELQAELTWAGGKRTDLYKGGASDQRRRVSAWVGERPASESRSEVREVRRPMPRFHVPMDPLVAVRGAKRSLRHHGDGRFSPDGLLQCRWPSQVATEVRGVADGADFIRSLPSGAIPEEVLALVQNAIVQDPYLAPWLASVEAGRRGLNEQITRRRLGAEAALRFGKDGIYDGGTSALGGERRSSFERAQVADQLRRFSLVAGVDTDPVGVTVWSQPWVPLWLEWEVELEAADRFDGWRLAQNDLDPPESLLPAEPRTFTGRSPLHTGTARTLAAAIDEWLKVEEQRDQNNTGEIDAATADALDAIGDAIGQLDVVATTLNGLTDRLLGLPVDQFGVLSRRNGAETLTPPAPIAAPQLLVAGALHLSRARIVDAFGRSLDVPVSSLRVPARDEIAGSPPSLRLRPRLTRPARWMFRLVDPGDLSADSREASIDQIDATQMVNPVAGFLLPDHIDEALEMFDAAGEPLGQLMHEPFGGGAVWEIAPGRTGPADAGPLHGLQPAQQALGHIAAGMVAADAAERKGNVAPEGVESALSGFLRAVDTTLWSVDTFAQLGTEHIAGLVGRPIAVVRAILRLEIDDDFDELDLSDEARRLEREAAYRALADRDFPVRLGELTRTDDGLLAFFVDDDYTRVHVVDKVVRDAALEGGRGRGHFDQLGSTKQVPDVDPIVHPYVVADDELHVRPAQVVRLTLLLHPAGKVHLTSGVLPRKALQLARDWVRPGLAVMAPSVRVGPVLVDPEKIRLPKISSFPKDQIWTRRGTPFSWKDDPILAATQTALLPDIPAEVQEGYIRVAPKQTTEG